MILQTICDGFHYGAIDLLLTLFYQAADRYQHIVLDSVNYILFPWSRFTMDMSLYGLYFCSTPFAHRIRMLCNLMLQLNAALMALFWNVNLFFVLSNAFHLKCINV